MGEEAIQYDHNVTFEKVWASLMELSESGKETDRRIKEFDRGMQELKLSMQETDRRLQETDRLVRETAEQMKETDKKVGKLSNNLGELIEKLLVPDTLAKFKAMGYTFTKIGPNVIIKGEHNRNLAEIDFVLENGEYVMIGEVKLRPHEEDVIEHVERMKKVRAHSYEHGDTRKFIGAIAGAIFRDDVKKRAQAAGFYVITASGEDVDIEPSPEGWEPRTEWA
jgi:hypothetical protein